RGRPPGVLEIDQRAVLVEQDGADWHGFLREHDLFRKPDSAFRDHALPNRASEKRARSCRVAPAVARSARISPITGANLKPWPEHGDATMTWGAPGRRSTRKSPSRVIV